MAKLKCKFLIPIVFIKAWTTKKHFTVKIIKDKWKEMTLLHNRNHGKLQE